LSYLDPDVLAQLDPVDFQNTQPYPWLSIQQLITPEGYESLRHNLPSVEQCRKSFGRWRLYGQTSHDRYVLEWRWKPRLAEPWQAFIEELQGPIYGDLLRRMLGVKALRLNFHWHYTPTGCSVSPHCDSPWKLGSHIFYFNDQDDWDPAWGGGTLILDDQQARSWRSAPSLDELETTACAPSLGNTSLLFQRTAHSWHAVRPLQCPEGALRRVFIVEIIRGGIAPKVRHYFG
jgi:hypothetical protein